MMKTVFERYNELQELADVHEGKSLSSTYVSSRTKYTWQCKEGHVWEAATSSIRNGSWCPACARRRNGKERLTIEIMHEIAKSNDGQCLSDSYNGSHIPLTWRCKRHHTWEMKPARARQGAWCPTCNKLKRRHQVSYEEIVASVTQRGGKVLSLADHYNLANLRLQCHEGHEWTARWSNVRAGSWCLKCSVQRKKSTLADMHQLAKTRGGSCLSTEYIRSTKPLLWQCHLGHQWAATPASIRQGSWCPTCSYTFSRRQKQSIAFMDSFAKARGGRCLSTEFHDIHTALSWECQCGFQWQASPASVKRGQWCPVCK
ncbi:hypothetical protein CN918_30580 [Priestia megaterium]|nr:hypothetical protein CN918_30580 [Priestia megaterium]